MSNESVTSEADLAVYPDEASRMIHAIISGNFETVKELLKAGNSPNFCARTGESALDAAILVGRGKERMVRLLLEHGADINGCSNDGWTPLMTAAHCSKVKIVTVLIREGADVNAISRNGDTALSLAHRTRALGLTGGDATRVSRAEAVIALLSGAGAKD